MCRLLKYLHFFPFYILNSVKTAPSFGDAAMGRIAQGAKVGDVMRSLLSVNSSIILNTSLQNEKYCEPPLQPRQMSCIISILKLPATLALHVHQTPSI